YDTVHTDQPVHRVRTFDNAPCGEQKRDDKHCCGDRQQHIINCGIHYLCFPSKIEIMRRSRLTKLATSRSMSACVVASRTCTVSMRFAISISATVPPGWRLYNTTAKLKTSSFSTRIGPRKIAFLGLGPGRTAIHPTLMEAQSSSPVQTNMYWMSIPQDTLSSLIGIAGSGKKKTIPSPTSRPAKTLAQVSSPISKHHMMASHRMKEGRKRWRAPVK